MSMSRPRRLTRPASVASSHQQPATLWELHVGNKHANTQCIQYAVHSCVWFADITWHSQVHGCSHLKLNILLSSPTGANVITCLYEQYKKELKIALTRGISTSTVASMGESPGAALSGANIRARGRSQTCVEFPTLIYSAQGKYCYSKTVLKIANGRSRWELRSSDLLCSEQW